MPPGVTLPPGFTLPSSTTTEFGGADFVRYTRDAFLSSVGAGSSVSIGGCIVFTFRGQSGISSVIGAFTGLDAGAAINLNGPNGSRQLTKLTTGGFKGSYSASLATGTQPAYLTPGSYTLSGTGGADVGAFQASITAGSSLNWLNQSSITTVNRSQDLQITWSGGGNGNVEIIGSSVSIAGGAASAFGASFVCSAAASAGQFTIPSVVLLALPAGSTQTVGGVSIPTGSLSVGSVTFAPFTATGIDQGIAVYTDTTGKSVSYQ